MALASKEDVSKEVQRAEGNLRRAAARLGVSREYIYRLVDQYELWPVVNKARVERITAKPKTDLIVRARNTLKS